MRLFVIVDPSAIQDAIAAVWKTRFDTSEPIEAQLWAVHLRLVEELLPASTCQHKFIFLCFTSQYRKAIFI